MTDFDPKNLTPFEEQALRGALASSRPVEWEPPRPPPSAFKSVFTFVVFAVFSVLATFAEISGLQDQAASASWPNVPGVITHSAVDRPTGSRHSRAVIIYRYKVNGREYEHHRIHAGLWRMSDTLFRTSQSLVDEYPVGTNLPVYYNPAVPDRGVLRVGITGRDWAESLGLLAIVYGLTLFSLWDIVGTRRKRAAMRGREEQSAPNDFQRWPEV
jgi:hypothetical protein